MLLFLGLCLAYINSINAQQFKRVENQIGLGGISKSNGVAIADYDNDGYQDIFIVSRVKHDINDPSTHNKLFRNKGDGSFEDKTVASGLNSFYSEESNQSDVRNLGLKLGASWGDYNNDGFQDLILTGVGFQLLYKNNGDGTFTDVTTASGITKLCGDCTTTSSVWWD